MDLPRGICKVDDVRVVVERSEEEREQILVQAHRRRGLETRSAQLSRSPVHFLVWACIAFRRYNTVHQCFCITVTVSDTVICCGLSLVAFGDAMGTAVLRVRSTWLLNKWRPHPPRSDEYSPKK